MAGEGTETFRLIVQENDSDPVDVSLASATFEITDNDAPSENQPPEVTARQLPGVFEIGEPIQLSELFSVSDPNEEDLLNIEVNVGEGATLQLDGVNTARTSFDVDEFLRLAIIPTDGAPAITVAASDGTLSDSATIVLSANELQSANSLELEYFARQSAYGEGSLGVEGRLGSSGNLGAFLDGWRIEEVFGDRLATGDDTFRAIALHKDGFRPVLAFRGTSPDPDDWAENFNSGGVGELEFRRGLDIAGPASGKTLRQWMEENQGLSITGHSQGGAQAQLAALYMARNELGIGQVVTFNSAGISTPGSEVGRINPDKVRHFVNASDIVSVIGDTFLPGELSYYDTAAQRINPYLTTASAHTAHWSQTALLSKALGVYQDAPIPVELPSPTDFFNGSFSPVADRGQDSDYFDTVYILLATFFLAAFPDRLLKTLNLTESLLTADYLGYLKSINEVSHLTDYENLWLEFAQSYDRRDEIELLRENRGEQIKNIIDDLGANLDTANLVISAQLSAGLLLLGRSVLDLGRQIQAGAISVEQAAIEFVKILGQTLLSGLEIVGELLVGLGDFLIDSAQGATLQTWASATDLTSWIADRFGSDGNIAVADGTNSGSTPAVVLNVQESSAGEILSSQVSGSIFLITDKNTQVNQVSGSNLIWGLSQYLDGTVVTGGVDTTDEMFVQNEQIGPENLDLAKGSAIIRIDLDLDGTTDITVTWEGEYRLSGIVTEIVEDGTYIRYLGNEVPVFGTPASLQIEEGATLAGTVAASDADSDGVRYAITGGADRALFEINPQTGEIGFLGAPDFENPKDVDKDNGYELTVTADDGDGGRAVQSITVEVLDVNEAPIAKDDSANVFEDNSVTIDVQANDHDPEKDKLSVSLVSAPSDGILVLNEDGTFTYEADADVFDLATPGDVIDQTFIYEVDDGFGGKDQATATILVTILDDGEVLSGANRAQILTGTDGGEDLLFGGNGDDELYGLDGGDTLYGERGNDLLDGGEGPDQLFGGRGDDVLRGGPGDDGLNGGKGADKFVLAIGEGVDTIFDFGDGLDRFRLDGLTVENLDIEQAEQDATISVDGELLAIVRGIDAATLASADVFGLL
ncbi:MAG: cadherin-like domain-containing protein [Planctomycetales bacterium]|nr:cadherin-like domain-containing protein [Planctomycetales bacterium]